MPITPFIGVRISWLMFARNCDFAALASCARRAFASACSDAIASAVARRAQLRERKTLATTASARATAPARSRLRRACARAARSASSEVLTRSSRPPKRPTMRTRSADGAPSAGRSRSVAPQVSDHWASRAGVRASAATR